MRKLLLTIIFIGSVFILTAQTNFQGQWSWNPSDRVSVVIDIEQAGSVIKGTHSSIYQAGNRIDGSFDKDDITINGTVENGIAIFSIQSGYQARTPGIATLTFIDEDTVLFKLTTPPTEGEYYLPSEAEMIRVK